MLVDGSGKVRGIRLDPNKDRRELVKAVLIGWTFRRSSEIKIIVLK